MLYALVVIKKVMRGIGVYSRLVYNFDGHVLRERCFILHRGLCFQFPSLDEGSSEPSEGRTRCWCMCLLRG